MTAPVDLPQLTAMQFDRRLLSDLRAVLAHHAFTRDRIGQPGCEVRKVAAEHAETIERAIAEACHEYADAMLTTRAEPLS